MIYNDDNYRQLIRVSATVDGAPQWYPRQSRYGTAEASSMGLVPMGDFPDMLPDPSDFKAIITYCHEQKIFPMYHLDSSGVMNAGWDQDGYGFCWAYGLTAAVMGCRNAEGKPPKRLSPFGLGECVNWKNSGYYCDRAIAYAKTHGIPEVAYVPEYNLRPSTFKSGWQQNALLHRPREWWDTEKTSDLQMIRQGLAILMTGRAGYDAYDWWSHALAAVGMDWDESQPNNVVWINWNSHADGLIRMAGSRGVPDELYGVRATEPTDE